ncbi:MAG: RNA polymerase sigma factor [Solirubrobacteraceae bacterium MAG38_C4-C5]|nr:RNA polymerase sigma factor [Candidatus Siliceabacter maunaloa]
MDDRADDELLQATAAEPEAFAAFYRRHATAVLGYLRRRTGDIETAADLTAEAFAQALTASESFDTSRGPARAWLFGITNHVLSAHRRRGHAERRARRALGISELGFAPDELARADEMLDARLGGWLAALVADLPADQREAVLARVVQEREYEEIAAATASTPAAVRQRVSRGLRRLSLNIRREEP